MAQPRDDASLLQFARRVQQRPAVAAGVMTPAVKQARWRSWAHTFDILEIISVAQIQPTENVLDLGTGHGDVARLATVAAMNGQVYGVDYNIHELVVAVALNRPVMPNLHFTHGNVVNMRDPSNNQPLTFPVQFDVVTVSWLLHNIRTDAERRQIFRGLRPYLKPDARLVLDFCSLNDRNALAGAHLWHGVQDTGLHFRWTDTATAARVIAEFQGLVSNYNIQAIPDHPVRLYMGPEDAQHVFINIATQIPPLFMSNFSMLRPALEDRRVSAIAKEGIRQFLQLHAAINRSNAPQTISQWVAHNIKPFHTASTVDPNLVNGHKWFTFLQVCYAHVLQHILNFKPSGRIPDDGVSTYPKMYQAIGVFRYRPLSGATITTASGVSPGA